MMRLDAVFRLVLAALLALTSAHAAVARTATGQVSWVEICAGTTTTSVAVDAEGNPVRAHPSCPDCVMATAGLGPLRWDVAAPDARKLPPFLPVLVSQWRGHIGATAPARGPPVSA